MSIHRNDTASQFNLIWDALMCYREDCISTDDDLWSDICTAMAWLQEDAGLEIDMSTGDLVEVTS